MQEKIIVFKKVKLDEAYDLYLRGHTIMRTLQSGAIRVYKGKKIPEKTFRKHSNRLYVKI